MGHFAKIGENNEVLSTIAVDNKDIVNEEGNEVEQIGIDYLTVVTGDSSWKQTSINSSFRTKLANVGDVYSEDMDCFHSIEPPYPSWSLNSSNCMWEAPTPKPDDVQEGYKYEWVELTQSWSEVALNDGEKASLNDAEKDSGEE